MARLVILVVILISLGTSTAGKSSDFFDVNQLPVGHSITLPHTTKSMVSVDASIKLKSTDLPQTVHLSIHNPSGTAIESYKIAIYDPNAARVRYVDMVGSNPILYSFKALGTIRLVPVIKKKAKITSQNLSRVKLQIASDKPLGVGR